MKEAFLPDGWTFRRAVRARTSIRSYKDSAFSDQLRAEIEKLLARPSSPPFGHPVRFEFLDLAELSPKERSAFGTYGFIRGARYFIAAIVEKSPRSMEDLGYCLEEAVLLLTARGLGTCWLGGTFKRSRVAEFLELRDREVVPAVTPVGYPADRRGIGGRLVRLAAGSSNRKPWDKLFFTPPLEPLSKAAAGDWEEPLECLRLAPSASNRQPWRVIYRQAPGGDRFRFFLKRTPGYGKLTGEISLQDIDMGIGMCHFELALREVSFEGSWELETINRESVPEEWEYITSWAAAGGE